MEAVSPHRVTGTLAAVPLIALVAVALIVAGIVLAFRGAWLPAIILIVLAVLLWPGGLVLTR